MEIDARPWISFYLKTYLVLYHRERSTSFSMSYTYREWLYTFLYHKASMFIKSEILIAKFEHKISEEKNSEKKYFFCFRYLRRGVCGDVVVLLDRGKSSQISTFSSRNFELFIPKFRAFYPKIYLRNCHKIAIVFFFLFYIKFFFT